MTTPNAPAWVRTVLPSDIVRQRSLGWPDFHPEDFCHACGTRNPCWFADAETWNAAIDGHGGIFCPTCFTDIYAAATSDDRTIWRLSLWIPRDRVRPWREGRGRPVIAVDTVPKLTACPRCRSQFTRRICLIRCCIDCGCWFLRGTR